LLPPVQDTQHFHELAPDDVADTILDWLASSMKQLIETIEKLRVRGIGFRSLTEALDTTTAQGLLVFHCSRSADRGGRVAPPAADPSQATGRVKRRDNQLHRARVLEVRIQSPPAESLRTFGS
jgi:hypothetical protein